MEPKIELKGEKFHYRKPSAKSNYVKKYENNFKANTDEFVKIEPNINNYPLNKRLFQTLVRFKRTNRLIFI